ncbi:hypothetical protein AWV79_17440 [Cupriavidus sp. UYMMa02A]|nr:hypothetical protein AWV79_17440 [Cupriavidus sp. UYMMa02A]
MKLDPTDVQYRTIFPAFIGMCQPVKRALLPDGKESCLRPVYCIPRIAFAWSAIRFARFSRSIAVLDQAHAFA